MRARPGLLAVTLLLSLAGCGETKDPAQAACDLHFSCDCSPTNFPDVETCVADVNALLARIDDADKAFASANGLVFDQECVDRERKVPDDLSCDYEQPESSKCVACAKIHGDQPLGAGCTEKDGYSNCARDLDCSDGVCLDPCQRLKAGDNCVGGASLARCADGLFCDSDNTKQCQPTGGPGAPCPTGVGCNEATYCAANRTCQPPPKDGEDCGPGPLCAELHYCDADNVCKAIPGEGQPCTIVCQEDLACEAGTCVIGPGVGEPCPLDGGDCGPDAFCGNDGICVAEQSGACLLMPAPVMD